jgi:hypothetical protein
MPYFQPVVVASMSVMAVGTAAYQFVQMYRKAYRPMKSTSMSWDSGSLTGKNNDVDSDDDGSLTYYSRGFHNFGFEEMDRGSDEEVEEEDEDMKEVSLEYRSKG